ncbi:MAG TPA: flagellar motor switch protein FliG [Candidatus Paceibacterota bacterium]|nr:flagellar motor switch protein FliG [Candidatus Paceibacterota bacterium]
MITATENPIPVEVSKMSKVQKLAALLVMLGPESAAQILKHLEERELEAVSAEMAKIGLLGLTQQRDIMREFAEVAIQASTGIRGGVDVARGTLEKAVGLFKASDLVGRIVPNRGSVTAMQQVIEMDARQIFNLVKHEQPQTVALVISYLNPEKGSQVLGMLRPESREQVVERLATMASTPIEVVEKVVEVLTNKVGGKEPCVLNQTGGIKSAAEVLNAMDKNLSKSLLLSLEEHNPELAQSIRQKMFTFDDLVALDAASLQKVLREVDMRDLAVSLKTASDKLKAKLLSCISKRAAETVNEEISFLGPLKIKESEAAQIRIIEAVRHLESEGEIDLSEVQEAMRHEALA